jgi:hypothetical protein
MQACTSSMCNLLNIKTRVTHSRQFCMMHPSDLVRQSLVIIVTIEQTSIKNRTVIRFKTVKTLDSQI